MSIVEIALAANDMGDVYVIGVFPDNNHIVVRLNSNGSRDTELSTGSGFQHCS